jgi:biotin carboxyl carrier protein
MTRALTITNGPRTATIHVESDGTVRVGDRPFRIEPLGLGVYRVSDETGHWLVAVAGPPDQRWVAVNGQVALCALIAASDRPPRRRAAADDLMAPMPATVIKMPVLPGTHVTAGTVLVVLEAMKMELAIRAPRDGVVRAVHCEVGDLVQPGVPLLEIE